MAQQTSDTSETLFVFRLKKPQIAQKFWECANNIVTLHMIKKYVQ